VTSAKKKEKIRKTTSTTTTTTTAGRTNSAKTRTDAPTPIPSLVFFKYWFLIWLLHEFSLMGKRLRSTSFCIVFKIISSFIFTKCHVVDLLCVVGKGEISLCW